MTQPPPPKKSLLNFPCDFPIKVMGLATPDFKSKVINTLRKHIPTLGEGALELRYSKDQKYLSITATFQATSQQQLDMIYRELCDYPEILVVL